jgi:hypothetical protein
MDYTREATATLYEMSFRDDGTLTDYRRVAPGFQLLDPPRWSPDGNAIAFAGSRADGSGIFTVRPDGGGLRVLASAQRCSDGEGGGTPTPGCDAQFHHPTWSPDGSELAFASDRDRPAGTDGDPHAIFVGRANGSGITRITPTGDDDRQPEWSAEPVPVETTEKPPACTDGATQVPAGTATTVALFCSDPNGDTHELDVVDGPAHGVLGSIDQTAKSVVYHPAAGYVGPDGFTYRAFDGAQHSNTAAVSLTVLAPPPPPPPPPPPAPATTPPPNGDDGTHTGAGTGTTSSSPRTGTTADCSPTALFCDLPIDCPAGAPGSCNGDMSNRLGGHGSSARLAVLARPALARRQAKPLIRRTRFRVAPGHRKTVRLKLTTAGRRQLVRKHTLRVTVSLRFRVGTDPYHRTTRHITLKLRRRR